jgi:acyl-coenzyme A thioesterase PaaI-like protein
LLGETAAALAFFTQLPKSKRAIVTQLNSEFFKKARGTVFAVAQSPPIGDKAEMSVTAYIKDQEEDGVTLAAVTVVFVVSENSRNEVFC